jgi:hypothetical protein
MTVAVSLSLSLSLSLFILSAVYQCIMNHQEYPFKYAPPCDNKSI